jgi:acyl-homoserine-lactone acylase
MRARPLLVLAALAACGAPPRSTSTDPMVAAAPSPVLRATVRWTSDGVPHVRADDWAGLGYGQGWAMASLHLCVLADQIVRVRGERARTFGAGDNDANIDSDFFHRHIGYRDRAGAALPRLSPEVQALVRGFAAGYNRYVTHTPSSKWPAPCRGAAWVRPIDEHDLIAHALAISTIASSRVFETMIARAAPRTGRDRDKHTAAPLPAMSESLASNGWALGTERTAHKGGLVVANPHFPWDGELMFYESHLTIPGQLDVYGAALVGIPLVNIGFNDKVAWTHTFSSSVRFVVYRLALAPGQPLRWRHGDEIRPIVGASYSVDVREPDGSLRTEKRTLYRTSFGPMLDSADLPWDPAAGTAFVLRDVALGAGEGFETYLDLARARDLDGVEHALARGGTPFVNTVAADASGEVLYADASRVPALRADALIAWQIGRKTIPALEAAWQKGVVILDGSRPMFDLASDDPSAPGAVAFADAPKVRRRDVVINANDSYRYTHPTAQLPDASPLYGDDAGRPSPRTLMNLRHVRAGTSDAGEDAMFDRTEAVAAMLSNRSYSALALRDDVVARCRGEVPGSRATGKNGTRRVRPKVPTGDARALCELLARWDGRFAVDSRGAALWRELLVELAPDARLPWARPYDPADPASAWGLDPRVGTDAIVAALSRARARLAAAGVAPDAPLGHLQRTDRGQASVGVPGGTLRDGVASVVKWVDWNGTLLPRQRRGQPRSDTGLDAGGWPVNYGTSFVMAVELGPDTPRADVLLTYGNSTDPASPRYRDQLEAFAASRLRPARFTETDIAADRGLVTEELSSP